MSFASDFEKKKTKKSRTSKMVEDTLEAAAVQKSISEAKQNEEIAKRDAEIAKDLGLAGRDMSDILNPNNFKSNPNYMTQAELEERRKKDKTVDKTLTYGGKEIGKVSEAAYRTLQYGNIDTYVPVNDEEKATLEKLKNSSGGKNKVKKIEDYIPKIGETKEQYETRRAADSSLPEFGTKEYFIAKVGEVGDLLDAAERSVADHKQIDPKDLAKLRETDPERVRKIDEDIRYHRSLAEEYAILVENLSKFDVGINRKDNGEIDTASGIEEARNDNAINQRYMRAMGSLNAFAKSTGDSSAETDAASFKAYGKALQAKGKEKAYEQYEKHKDNEYGNNAIGRIAGNYRMGAINEGIGQTGFDAYFADSDDLEATEVYQELRSRLAQKNAETFKNNNKFEADLASVTSYIPQLINQTKAQAAGAIYGLVGAGLTKNPKLINTGRAAGSAIYMFKQTAGQTYVDLMQADSIYISKEDARKLATDTALASSLVEFGLEYAAGKLWTKSGGAKVMDGAKNKITKGLISKGIKKQTAERLVGLAINAGKITVDNSMEGLEEFIQEGMSITASKATGAEPAHYGNFIGLAAKSLDFSQYTEEEIARMKESGRAGFVIGIVGTGGRVVSGAVTNRVADSVDSKRLGAQIYKSENGEAFVEAVATVAANGNDKKLKRQGEIILNQMSESGRAGEVETGEFIKNVFKEQSNENAVERFGDNEAIPENRKEEAVEVAAEITNLAANNVKKATNRDVNVPSLLNFSSGFVNDKDVSIDYNLMHSFAEVMAGCIDVNSTIAKNISASGRTIAGALTEYVLYSTGGDYIKSAQFRGAALSFADTFGKTVQALVGERTALYGQDSVLTTQAEALAKGDYSFMISGETQGVANAENNDIINNRYVVRDAVASAMGDTLAPDALGRIAAGFSDENGNADLGAFIDSMVNHYAENGNMGEYASLFADGGASVAEVINRTRGEINEKIQHSGTVQGRSVRDSENLGRRAGEYTSESGEGIQRGTGRTEETAYAGRTAEQEVGGVRYNEISRDDWSAEMEQLAQESSDKYGVETVYFAGEAVNEAGDKADAFYYDGVLYLQIDGEHDIRTLRDHEVTHHQEGSEAHGVFKESVKKKLGKEKYDELFRRYMDKYRKTLAKVIEKAQKESGGTLTDDELNQIARDYIDDEILANINAGTNEYAELCAEEVAAFRSAIENKAEAKEEVTTNASGKANDKPGEYKAEKDAGPRFRFVKTINGIRSYKTDFPKDMDFETKKAIFKERIAVIFKLGAVELKTDTKRIVIKGDRFTAQKNLYGDEYARDDELQAKVNSLYDLVDILATAKYDGKEIEESYEDPNIKPKNKAHEDVKYWYKFKNTIYFDDVLYDITFNIRDKGKKQYQYLIEFFEKNRKATHNSNTAKKSLLRTNELPSNKRIPQNGPSVNSNSMQKGKKDAQSVAERAEEAFSGSVIRGDDGKLKVMYRGGGEEIHIFDRKKSKPSNLYGRGFYFTDSESAAKQYGDVRKYYLNVKTPLSPGQSSITKEQMRNFLEAVAENEDDYDIWNYGTTNIDEILNNLYGKGDFEMLQDVNATAIGDLVEAVELFNEVNGAEYDGIVLDTETVVFDSAQIKSADKITYDDEGKEIPMSKRFSNSKDVRFNLIESNNSPEKLNSGILNRKVVSEYSKNVDAVLNGTYNSSNSIVMCGATKIMTDIGLNKIPVTISKEHIYSVAKSEAEAKKEGKFHKNTNYHGLGGAVVKDIPNKLENPIAIVAHPDFVRRRNRDSAHKVMVLVDFVHNGRSVIAPIEVDAEQNVRNLKMDVNHVATYFDKKNISDILKEALALESQGKTGFYFADIKRVAALLKGQGYQLPKSLRTHNSNIIIRKINTNVNRKIDTALKSHQFLKWFGDWLNNSAYASKVVNDDGTPKVVYHGSYSGFTVFGEGNKHSQAPDGAYFFTDDESVAYSYTGYKNEVDLSEADSGGWFPGGIYPVYLNMRKPYIVDFQGKLWSDKSIYGKDINEIVAYAKDNNYDGVIAKNIIDEGGQGDKNWNERNPVKPVTDYIVFEPTQIKSATDNIGTFDRSNPDIRFNLTSSGDYSTQKTDEELYDEVGLGNFMRTLEAYNKYIDTYGVVPKGEKASRDVQVPKKTGKNKYVSKFARTMMEAGVTPDEAVDEFKLAIQNGSMSHMPHTDKEAMQYAEDKINELGFDGAMERWKTIADVEGVVSKNEIAFGMELYNQCINAKDAENAMRIAVDLAHIATKAGQAVQAFRLLKMMSPDGQLYSLEKSVQTLNKELKGVLGKKAGEIKIDEGLAKEYLSADTDAKREEALDKLLENVAAQIPATWQDKFTAWRYLSMLGNPRTHVRNIVGNAIFYPVRKVKNFVGAALEKTISADDRTKALRKNKDAVEFAKKYALKVEKELKGSSGKYDISFSDLNDKRKIFNNKIIEALRKGNIDLMEAEDWWFLKGAYVDSFAQVMTARGITAEQLENGTRESAELIDKLHMYALKEAQRATFRDFNALANGINECKRKIDKSKNKLAKLGWYTMVEGVIPFKNTPLNIAKRAVEYSPFGLAKAMLTDVRKLKTDENFTSADLIDNIAKGLTGTGLMLLGMFLQSKGWINGGDDENKKKKKFDETIGWQGYALTISGYTYTIDWAAPAVLPLFIGVELMKSFENDGLSFKDVASSASKLLDPLLELSCLQSVSSLVETAGYSTESAVSALFVDALTSYIGQAFPTIAGQFARTIDKTRRTTYIDKSSDVPVAVSRFVQGLEAKIPFLSKHLEPRLDAWGGEMTYGDNPMLRALGNFISPGYARKKDDSKVARELNSLYERTEDAAVFPSIPGKTLTVDKVTHNLTGSQYTWLSKKRGSLSLEAVKELIASKEYESASDEEKIKMLEETYDDASDDAKLAFCEQYDIGINDVPADKDVKPLYSYEDLAESIYKGDTEREDKIVMHYETRSKSIHKASLTKEVKPEYVELLVDEPDKAVVIKNRLVESYGYDEEAIDEWIYDPLGDAVVLGDSNATQRYMSAIGGFDPAKLAKNVRGDFIELAETNPDAADALAETLMNEYGVKKKTIDKWYKTVNGE